MRCLIIDAEGMGLDMALRFADTGHDVRWFKYQEPNKPPTKDGQGFKGFKIVTDWREHMPWAKDGLIITTGNWRFLHELDRYRDLGYKIFSPTVASAALEIDRAKGMEAMKSVGIEIAPYHTFKSLQEAQAFARKSDQCWVFKTLGSEGDKSLSFVSCSPAEMVGWIQNKIDRGMVLKGPCMLQEKIDMLAEVGVSGWFGPDGFLPDKWNSCWEHKKLMDGEVGPNTGEMGTVTQYMEKDKLAAEMLMPMTPILQALGHRGDFALGAGIDTKGRAWPFEWTSRLGWPAFFIQMASHKGDPVQWMRDLLDGKDSLRVSYDVAVGVVMAQPMFPYGKSPPELVEGNPIEGMDEAGDNIHPIGVMIGRGPKMKGGKVVDGPIYQTTGEYVAVATGLGKTVTKARGVAYKAVDTLKYANGMHRTDIGCKLEKALPTLHKFGYVTSTRWD